MTTTNAQVYARAIGYPLNEDTKELLAPCGCPACDGGVQPGHFACNESPASVLAAEESGMVARSYDDGAWRWFVTARY